MIMIYIENKFIHYLKMVFFLIISIQLTLLIYCIVQAWATTGPRATYGPPSTLMWPASYIWSFLNSYIGYKKHQISRKYLFYNKNNLKISLHGHVLAPGYLTCL